MRTIAYIREDQADIRLTVNGVVYGDTWATYDGGALTASDAKTRPGGLGKEVSVGGPSSRGDLTLTIQMSDIVAGWHNTLESVVGGGTCKASVAYINPDRTPIPGATFSRTGTLKEASLPTATYDSGDVGMYQVVISCDELAA